MSLTTSTSLRSAALPDRYRVGRLVASGGMASIFHANDTQTGRTVAIKIPHPSVARDRAALGRFQHVAEISEKLDHPGLVKILPDDRADGRYVVMEWVGGQTLREVIDAQGTLTPARAIPIMLAVCAALDYLHQRGILHRDLKPENVLVDPDDNIKLIDLGIAAVSKGLLWTRSSPEDMMGTPDYASPEQIRGKRADARSDIYSLGIMSFEMLTGEVPFSGLDANTAVQLRALVDPPLLCEINPELPRGLQEIVARAIARDRNRRCASAREFASELRKFMAEASAEPPVELLARS
jgi:eukaryotic-like serine/threonine-protein kinase